MRDPSAAAADHATARRLKALDLRADERARMRTLPTNRKLDPLLSWGYQYVDMVYVELIPVRRPNGTIVLRGVVVGPGERLRRLLRRLSSRA
jgi:hypothetical protein